MTKRTWHKGPPPHIGWWNASKVRNKWAWRWWDGRCWSLVVEEGYPLDEVLKRANCPTWVDEIEWTTHWPRNARVPRIDPRTKTK